MAIDESTFRQLLDIPTDEDVADTVELLQAVEVNRKAFSAEIRLTPTLSIDWDSWQANALAPTLFEKLQQAPLHLLVRAALTFCLPIVTTIICIMLFFTALHTGSAIWWITAVGVGAMCSLMNFLTIGFFFLGGSLTELQTSLKQDPYFGFRSRMVIVPAFASVLALAGIVGTTLFVSRTSQELDPQLIVDLDSMRVMSKEDAGELREFLMADSEPREEAIQGLSLNVRGLLAESAGDVEDACKLYATAAKQGYEPAQLNFTLCQAEFRSVEMASAEYELTPKLEDAKETEEAEGERDDEAKNE